MLPLKKRKVNSGLAAEVTALKRKVSRISPDKQTYEGSGTVSRTVVGFQEAVIDVTSGCLDNVDGDFIIERVDFRVVPTAGSTVAEMRTDVIALKMDPTTAGTGATNTSQFFDPKILKTYSTSASYGQAGHGDLLMEGSARTGLVVKNTAGTVVRNRHYLIVRWRQVSTTDPGMQYAFQVTYKEK